MSDLPATATLDGARIGAVRPIGSHGVLAASALGRLALLLVPLACLWGLVFWALR